MPHISFDQLNDSEQRDCYYVFRAMHDGTCPHCGNSCFNEQDKEDLKCPVCKFEITGPETQAILDAVPDILKRRMDSYRKFRGVEVDDAGRT